MNNRAMANWILHHKKLIVILFTVVAVVGGIIQFAVPVNYNMTDYLPQNAPSTQAIDIMEDEFDEDVQDTRVMIQDVSIQEALDYKQQLKSIDGVEGVMWLDDVIDVKKPIETEDADTIETYYKDHKALYTFHVEEGKEVEATDAIYDLIGEENALSGDALDTAMSQKSTGEETLFAAAILIPVVIIILLLSTTAWMEPVFFLTAIGISVLINLGTNVFIGEISFISQAVAPILQLAVSLDYAIFLLHRFNDYRVEMENVEEAMKLAIKDSFPAISASASTTFFGFLALTFMNFEIGADLGLNLVKGILLSFISVMVFLPALIMLLYPYLDKTKHKQWVPTKFSIGKYIVKTRIPVLLLVLVLIVPAFLAQKETNFLYGMGDAPDDSREGIDAQEIEDVYGKFTPIVLLVDKGDLAREDALTKEIKDLQPVESVTSYSEVVGAAIPPEYAGADVRDQFFSENYSRIIINTTTKEEGPEAFQLADTIRSLAKEYYGDNYVATGESITMSDMKEIVEKDNTLVNILTVVTIAIVLLITFRSISFPILLLLTIQSSVWFNLSVPYLAGDSLVYIGYLIISIVQLAATVDYAILFSDDYVGHRQYMKAKDAIIKTINEKIFSITVPASILSSVGFILWSTSTDPIISSIGLLLGRGTLFAFLFVVFLLPALLIVFDRFVKKTTRRIQFYEKEK